MAAVVLLVVVAAAVVVVGGGSGGDGGNAPFRSFVIIFLHLADFSIPLRKTTETHP